MAMAQRSGMSTGHEGAATAGYNVDADVDEVSFFRSFVFSFVVPSASLLEKL
jgi:hypothetical protein